MSPFALRLRELREAAGLSQEALGAKAQVRQATISELEARADRGDLGRVDLDVIDRLAKALGVRPDELLVAAPKRRGARS